MHDDYIIGYNVNLEEKNIVIQTYNNSKKKHKKICFLGVLTHCFECIIDYNIIMDIEEYEISNFVKDNQEKLVKMKGYCWPVDYETEQDLMEFIINNHYQYIKINSSYGMFGWVLAKSYKIIE